MNELRNFFADRTIQGVFITAALGMIGWLFLRWFNVRLKPLSQRAKDLLQEMRGDTRSNPKGLTLFMPEYGRGDYFPYRWSPQQSRDLAIREICLELVLGAIDELVEHGYLLRDEEVDMDVTASYTLIK